MKLCTCTIAFREIGWEETLSQIKDIGFRYIEASAEIEKHLMLYVEKQEELVDIKKLIELYGLKVVAISGCNDFTLPENKIDAQIEWVKKNIDLTNKLGANILRVFAGHIKADELREYHYKQVIECLKEVTKYAKEKGIVLALENHYGITATPEQVIRIIDGVNSNVLGVNFDPANFVPCNIDPVEATRKLAQYIVHMHLKDCRKQEGGEHNGYDYCEIGAGIVNYKEILEIMKENNYNKYLSIEYEKAKDPTRGTKESLKNLQNILKEI